MRPSDISLGTTVRAKLVAFNKIRPLPGIESEDNLDCLTEQIIDSVRRIKYVTLIREKQFGPEFADATSNLFDPLKAAVWNMNKGNQNEAFWLVFLAVLTGKNLFTDWQLARDIYGGMGTPALWNWQVTSTNPEAFRQWLHENQSALRANGSFGNHRKYESLNAYSDKGTGAAVISYIEWVGPSHDHALMLRDASLQAGTAPRALFHYLYQSLGDVRRFGRMARFDYLTFVGKLGLANIEPGFAYMQGATGPLAGARLLFGGSTTAQIKRTTLEKWLIDLESHLELYFGMQVLEDALCNWQKNPNRFIHFRG